jgi:16S rRNA processing protein RimM
MVIMGRVLAPYGVSGWIKVRAFSASPATLIERDRWWLAVNDGTWREFTVSEARRHADTLLAHLEGLSRREDAAAWRGASIAVPRATLPELVDGEVYLADLIGLTVMSREGKTLGRVDGLLESPAHAVLRVRCGEGAEELIPLVSVYIDAIDLDAGRIVVDWYMDE